MNDMTVFNQNLESIPEPEQEIKPELKINLEEIWEEGITWEDVAQAIRQKETKQAFDLASDLILRQHNFKTMKDNEQLWYYQEGFYQQQGEAVLKEIIQQQKPIKGMINSHFVSEVIATVKRKTFIDREDFEAPLNLLCLKNGVYDIDTATLTAHSPNYFFKNRIEINYNENAKCEKIKQFIETTFEPQYTGLGFEISGFCLYRHYFIQRSVMLTGTGQNGKSVYLDLLTKLLNSKNISSETIQNLCGSNFGTAQLYGKLANICADLPSILIQDSGEFKKLTSGMEGDSISAQNKFENKFNFLNSAKLIFACNEVPESKDQTDGFFRRWIIIDFPYKFVSGLKEEEYIGFVKKENKGLIKELTTDSELEGFLFESLNSLRRLLLQGDFSNAPSINEIRLRYNLKSNSALVFCESFITDEVVEEEGIKDPFVIKEFLLDEYKAFCRFKGIAAKTDTGFFKTLKDRWNPESIKKLVSLGVRKNVYEGIEYLPVWREKLISQ
jgi:putative DNA primase/helicase